MNLEYTPILVHVFGICLRTESVWVPYYLPPFANMGSGSTKFTQVLKYRVYDGYYMMPRKL